MSRLDMGHVRLVRAVLITLDVTHACNKLLLVNDNGEHRKMNNFLLTAPKILILGSENRA